MAFIRTSALLLCAILIAPQGIEPAKAASYYGAIALSNSNLAYGWANNHTSRRRAENQAMRRCSQYASDCTIVMWMGNSCMALARGRNTWGAAHDPNAARARNIAMRVCRNHGSGCKLEVLECSN